MKRSQPQSTDSNDGKLDSSKPPKSVAARRKKPKPPSNENGNSGIFLDQPTRPSHDRLFWPHRPPPSLRAPSDVTIPRPTGSFNAPSNRPHTCLPRAITSGLSRPQYCSYKPLEGQGRLQELKGLLHSLFSLRSFVQLRRGLTAVHAANRPSAPPSPGFDLTPYGANIFSTYRGSESDS